MMRMGILSFAFALASASATDEAPRIEAGQPFPDLALPRMEDGRAVSVSDFRGQKLVLHIWASW